MTSLLTIYLAISVITTGLWWWLMVTGESDSELDERAIESGRSRKQIALLRVVAVTLLGFAWPAMIGLWLTHAALLAVEGRTR